MNKYNKSQSMVIALWVLSLGKPAPGPTAPECIVRIVNQLGDTHSSDSIFLHTHGYERLFLERPIKKKISKLQREIASELEKSKIAERVFDT